MSSRKHMVAWATDPAIRRKASSGGVGSAVVKMLFEKKQITAALSFKYETRSYKPYFAKNFNEYRISGSIYQEIDIFKFYFDNLKNESVVNGPVLVFTLPCQTKAIRALANKRGIKVIVVGLVCSSQQSRAATSYLLKRVGIVEDDVVFLRYRGNGWPSGIQIKMRDGAERFISNNGSIWTKIFHSRLFINKRCFFCADTLNDNADIVLADPWVPQYSGEKIGKTFIRTNTELGASIIESALSQQYIAGETLGADVFEQAQQMTIVRKRGYAKSRQLTSRMISLFSNRFYRFAVLRSGWLFGLHCRIKNHFEAEMYRNLIALKGR